MEATRERRSEMMGKSLRTTSNPTPPMALSSIALR